MAKDIVPNLLEQIQNDFDKSYGKSEVISQALAAIETQNATYETANDFAIELGEILSKVLKGSISSATLPDGKMYYNIAKRLLEVTLGRNFKEISRYSEEVQQYLNDKARIGLKVQVPTINQDRIDGMVNRLATEDNFDKVKWMLGDPIVNFSQSIVDDSIKKNAEFHAKVGLKPKIVRTAVGKCCKWCQNLAGSYDYPNVPQDVYRRHQNCRCTVNYKSDEGKRQNVWTKRIVERPKSDIIESRKNINLKKTFDTSRYAHNTDGTIKVSRVVERKIPNDVKPYEVIDVVNVKGVASRTYIDKFGRRGMRIDTSDHGQPKYHPMGAHKHIMEYDKNGSYLTDGKPSVLSPKDRKENGDIL